MPSSPATEYRYTDPNDEPVQRLQRKYDAPLRPLEEMRLLRISGTVSRLFLPEQTCNNHGSRKPGCLSSRQPGFHQGLSAVMSIQRERDRSLLLWQLGGQFLTVRLCNLDAPIHRTRFQHQRAAHHVHAENILHGIKDPFSGLTAPAI